MESLITAKYIASTICEKFNKKIMEKNYYLLNVKIKEISNTYTYFLLSY